MVRRVSKRERSAPYSRIIAEAGEEDARDADRRSERSGGALSLSEDAGATDTPESAPNMSDVGADSGVSVASASAASAASVASGGPPRLRGLSLLTGGE